MGGLKLEDAHKGDIEMIYHKCLSVALSSDCTKKRFKNASIYNRSNFAGFHRKLLTMDPNRHIPLLGIFAAGDATRVRALV